MMKRNEEEEEKEKERNEKKIRENNFLFIL